MDLLFRPGGAARLQNNVPKVYDERAQTHKGVVHYDVLFRILSALRRVFGRKKIW